MSGRGCGPSLFVSSPPSPNPRLPSARISVSANSAGCGIFRPVISVITITQVQINGSLSRTQDTLFGYLHGCGIFGILIPSCNALNECVVCDKADCISMISLIMCISMKRKAFSLNPLGALKLLSGVKASLLIVLR